MELELEPMSPETVEVKVARLESDVGHLVKSSDNLQARIAETKRKLLEHAASLEIK